MRILAQRRHRLGMPACYGGVRTGKTCLELKENMAKVLPVKHGKKVRTQRAMGMMKSFLV